MAPKRKGKQSLKFAKKVHVPQILEIAHPDLVQSAPSAEKTADEYLEGIWWNL